MTKYYILGLVGVALLVYGYIDLQQSVGANIGPSWLWFIPGLVLVLVAGIGFFSKKSK